MTDAPALPPHLVPQPGHRGRARRRPHAVDGLGVLATPAAGSPRWPRFALQTLHRNVSLLACALLVAHAVTPVLDTYVNHYASISPVDALVPFVAAYRPFALGLGTLALDLGRGRRPHQRRPAPAGSPHLVPAAPPRLRELGARRRPRAARSAPTPGRRGASA